MSGSFQDEVKEALADPKDSMTAAVGDLRNEFGELRSHLRGLTFGEDNSSTPSSTSSSKPAPTPGPEGSMTSGGPPGLPPAPDDPSLN